MPRKYELKHRAERMEETRRRIIEAADRLHGTVGFVNASISAVAEAAGVERLTIYRHFPDERTLVAACAVNFFTHRPLPDPAPWRRTRDPEERLRTALGALYEWYGANEGNLANFFRDAPLKPFLYELGAPMVDYFGRVCDLLAAGRRARGRRRRRLLAAIGHALDFQTWRSLVRQQGLSDGEAVELMVRLVRSV